MSEYNKPPYKPKGRPLLYKPEYCQQIIDAMSEGKSMTAFAGEIRVHRMTLNDWIERYPEFREAVNIGKAACAAWWEERGRKIAEEGGGNGSASMVAFGLKNMGQGEWNVAERKEVTGKDGAPLALGNADLSQLSAQTLMEIKALLEANSVPRVIGGHSTEDE